MDSLVRRILSGENQAVVLFYNEYSPKIRKYLQYRMPRTEDIEAFTNDIFLEVIDSLPLFQEKCSLLSWLYKIAHNKIVDFYRKKKIKSVLLSQIPFLEVVAHEVYEPEFQYEKNKIRDKIEQTLREMSHTYRRILRLHYEEQKPVKQIALELDLSYKAAESLLFRARQQFKKAYEKR